MTAKQLFRIIITASLLFPPLFFIAWDENLDPPFIANTAYDFLTHKLLPVLSVIISIAGGMYGYKKYNACITFKSNFKDYKIRFYKKTTDRIVKYRNFGYGLLRWIN